MSHLYHASHRPSHQPSHRMQPSIEPSPRERLPIIDQTCAPANVKSEIFPSASIRRRRLAGALPSPYTPILSRPIRCKIACHIPSRKSYLSLAPSLLTRTSFASLSSFVPHPPRPSSSVSASLILKSYLAFPCQPFPLTPLVLSLLVPLSPVNLLETRWSSYRLRLNAADYIHVVRH